MSSTAFEQLPLSGFHTKKIESLAVARSGAQLFAEAVALAKLRLLPADPAMGELYLAWARHSEEHADYEQAAKCYLAVGNGRSAVHSLARRGGAPALRCAYDVGVACELDAAALATLAERVVEACVAAGDGLDLNKLWEHVGFEIAVVVFDVARVIPIHLGHRARKPLGRTARAARCGHVSCLDAHTRLQRARASTCDTFGWRLIHTSLLGPSHRGQTGALPSGAVVIPRAGLWL